MENKISFKSRMVFLILLVLLVVSVPSVIALNKPVQGFVRDADELKDVAVVVLATVKDKDKVFECYTFPEIVADERGYYITDLANLKKTVDGSDCSVYWNKGDKIKVIARSGDNYFSSIETSIPDRSGAEFNLPDLLPVDYKIEFAEVFSKALLHIEKVTVHWENEFYVISVVLANDGENNYDDVSINFNVFSSGQNVVERISQDNLQINSSERKEVELRWDTNGFAGSYDGEINLYANGELVDVFPIPQIFIPYKNKADFSNFNILNSSSVFTVLIVILIIVIIILLYKIHQKKIKKIKKRKNQK